ncbi:hypothetical protein BN1723_012614 [Verticillium longisporum]|uniref:Uncharacterized protein n=1 Tax=Verticillium longisporum TaxID=100787 RepID=A0A0G4LJK6_VERLO|nr:hypothetical protein BN1723_012614 [Verticillium longisporum]
MGRAPRGLHGGALGDAAPWKEGTYLTARTSLTARCAGNERGLGQFESSELERQTDGSPSRPRGLSSRHEPVATAYRAKQAIDRHKDADPTPNRPRASSKSFGARCGGVITCSQEDPPTL